MAPILLFITGVLAGVIAGFILSRVFSKGRSSGGSGEARLLEERLLKADQGLEQFSRQLEQQSADLQSVQHEAQQARESAAVSSTELKGVSRERDALKVVTPPKVVDQVGRRHEVERRPSKRPLDECVRVDDVRGQLNHHEQRDAVAGPYRVFLEQVLDSIAGDNACLKYCAWEPPRSHQCVVLCGKAPCFCGSWLNSTPPALCARQHRHSNHDACSTERGSILTAC